MTLAGIHQALETDRLRLRRIQPSDLPFFTRIHADPEVARYISHGRPRTEAESATWLEQVIECYAATGLGQLAVTDRSTGELLGRCGLSYMEVVASVDESGARIGYYYPARPPASEASTVEAELGYTFDRAAWGRGYAAEAVTAVFRYATSQLRRVGLISLIHADNVRSLKVASRFGVAREDRVSLWGRSFDRYRWPDGDPAVATAGPAVIPA